VAKISCKTSLRADELDERRSLRILLVEENGDDEHRFRETIENLLNCGMVTTYTSIGQALAASNFSEYDIAVIGDGEAANSVLDDVALFKSACSALPQIVLTRCDDEQVAQSAIDIGAQDYLIKPLARDGSIRDRMLYAIARHAMNISDRVVIQQLEATSQLDSLTNLLNRRAFDQEFERQLAIANRNGSPLSVGVIDIDFFKTINDKFGHMVGDQTLVSFAKLLKITSRVSDIPCRFGGEEFCVILADTDAEEAFIWAEKVCRSVRETKLDSSRGPISITVSIGVATLPKGATSIRETLEQADAGCLEAKSRGRDQVVVAFSQDPLKAGCSANGNSLMMSLQAQDVMSLVHLTVLESISIAEAARLMLDCQSEVLAVVTSTGTFRGLLTNEDIVSHILRNGDWNDQIDSITGQTATFHEDTAFERVWNTFQRLPIRRAIVTRDERPVGIINRGQLLRRLATDLDLFNLPIKATGEAQSSTTRVFEQINQLASDYLSGKFVDADELHEKVTLVSLASQLQELSTQLLSFSAPRPRPGKDNRENICSATAFVNL
jgi:diguanylate cyclase (GGDEF)-like protein